jgi:hypothetical protein
MRCSSASSPQSSDGAADAKEITGRAAKSPSTMRGCIWLGYGQVGGKGYRHPTFVDTTPAITTPAITTPTVTVPNILL